MVLKLSLAERAFFLHSPLLDRFASMFTTQDRLFSAHTLSTLTSSLYLAVSGRIKESEGSRHQCPHPITSYLTTRIGGDSNLLCCTFFPSHRQQPGNVQFFRLLIKNSNYSYVSRRKYWYLVELVYAVCSIWICGYFQ